MRLAEIVEIWEREVKEYWARLEPCIPPIEEAEIAQEFIKKREEIGAETLKEAWKPLLKKWLRQIHWIRGGMFIDNWRSNELPLDTGEQIEEVLKDSYSRYRLERLIDEVIGSDKWALVWKKDDQIKELGNKLNWDIDWLLREYAKKVIIPKLNPGQAVLLVTPRDFPSL